MNAPKRNLTNKNLFLRANSCFPGAVNSPVRSFQQVGCEIPYIARGAGAYIYDVEENKYLDFCQSWGPLLLGHAPEKLLEDLKKQLHMGLSYGACHPLEVEYAEFLQQHIPSLELLRFVCSGTEATMTAIRLARSYTQRSHIVKFSGCYHGHSDSLLVQAGSALAGISAASSSGVNASTVAQTIVLTYNDVEGLEQLFSHRGEEIAALIVEPLAGNMGLVEAKPEFLKSISKLCKRYSAVFIADEVISGFRLGLGSYCQQLDIEPDLYCLGKIIGAGLPVGLVGGQKSIMADLAPLGTTYQAGTLASNPLALRAGFSSLKYVEALGARRVYMELEAHGKALVSQVQAHLPSSVCLEHKGSLFTLFFRATAPQNFAEAQESNLSIFAQYYQAMLAQGIYLSPAQFELNFISMAHTAKNIEYLADTMLSSLTDIYE